MDDDRRTGDESLELSNSDTDKTESHAYHEESEIFVINDGQDIPALRPFPFRDDDNDGGLAQINGVLRDEDIATIKKQMASISRLTGHTSLTARDIITLCALSRVLQSGQQKSKIRAAVHLAHLVILRYCKLAQRSVNIPRVPLGPFHDAYMREFTASASCALWGWFDGEFASAQWDAFDLFDGRIYHHVAMRFADLTFPDPLHRDIMQLAEILKQLSGMDTTGQVPARTQQQHAQAEISDKTEQTSAVQGQAIIPVLPFSHPVLDPFLQPVQVKTAELSKPPLASNIFQELTHWHNSKKPLDPKFIPKAPGFFTRKRNQKLMADTIAYSASLTGSSGKIIDPEIIVVQTPTIEKKPKVSGGSRQKGEATLKDTTGAKAKVTLNGKQPVKSGKQKGLEAAEALKAGKTQEKLVAVIASWAKQCAEFEKEDSLIRKYVRAQKYLLGLSTEHATTVGSEVSLYICHVLTLLGASKNTSQRNSKRTSYPAHLSRDL